MTTKKELNALKKEIKALERKLDKFLKAVEKSGTKTTKAKAVKAKPAQKATKAPVKKKATKVSATDQVLNIINSSEKGVDATTLKKKTGFNDKKIRNIIFRTMKQGKIQSAERGVYVGIKQD